MGEIKKAPNNRKRWTEKEIEMLKKGNLTDYELSKELGRSMSAIKEKRHVIGAVRKAKQLDKGKLHYLYIEQQLPIMEVAKELGVSHGMVGRYLKKYGIKARTQEEAFEALRNRGWAYPESTRKAISESKKKGGMTYQ